jgi:serine/threonine protein kinase
VWLARCALGLFRAVKVVRLQDFGDRHPFEREFAGVLRFEPLSRTHDGFVDLLQVGRSENGAAFYCVMELADDAAGQTGGVPEKPGEAPMRSAQDALAPKLRDPATYTPRSLKSEIHRRGPLPARECVELGLGLSKALAFLHQHGLVHRDIKPSNILFVGGVPKLADIGLVVEAGDSASYVGTDGYIPPEGPGTPQADLFALGKVLYEASTGMDRLAFPQLPKTLPAGSTETELAELNAVILRACDPDRRQRYPSVEEMERELALVRDGLSVRRRRAGSKRRLRWALAAAGLGLALAGLLWTARPFLFGSWAGPGARFASQPQPLDLLRFFNARLDQNWVRDFPDNNLAALPTGTQMLGGIPFRIEGLIQLGGLYLAPRGQFPFSAEGIPVGRRCRRLHFLHGTVWIGPKGMCVAQYRVTYADGQELVIPVEYGRHVRNWWSSPQEPPSASNLAGGAELAWTGTNASEAWRNAGSSPLQLFKMTWENPRPGIPITSLDFVSSMTASCPFLIAVTSE